ncbi:MAG: radical SAM protein [Verrucomicrobiota bacterium]
MTAGIQKRRREWFGGIVYSENPGFAMHVDHAMADSLGIPPAEGLVEGLYSAPLDAHIAVTTRCNRKCRECYALNRDEPGVDLPPEQGRAIIDRLAAMDVFTVAFGGGEPFLYPHLFELASHARLRNIVPNITTNGSLIERDTADRCRIFGSVHVSCHRARDLEALSVPVRLLSAVGVTPGLNMLVTSESFDDLPEVFRWAGRQGIGRVLLLRFKLTANNPESSPLLLSAGQLRQLPAIVRRLSRRHGILPLFDCSLFPTLTGYRWAARKRLEYFDVEGCRGGNKFLAVTVSGDFKPCSFWPTTFGRAADLDRTTWAANPRLNEFRRQREHAACDACSQVNLCNGGCRLMPVEHCGCPLPRAADRS